MALTMKEFLVGLEGKVDGEFEEKRVELIAAIDAKNLKRKNTPTKKQAENEPIKAQIVEYLENEGKAVLGVDIAKALTLTPQKLTGVAGLLVKDGVLKKSEVAVKGKGKQIAYEIA